MMKKRRFQLPILILLLFPFMGMGSTSSKNVSISQFPIDRIKLPPGFSIQVYAKVPHARSLSLSPKGILYVGTRQAGKVYAVQDQDKDGFAETVHVIAQDLNMPNGVAYRDGDLYVAEVSRVIRFENIESSLSNPPRPEVVFDGYPTDNHHGWKYIRFGPDGWLYVPVGAPCNICSSKNPIYATITRIKPDGSGLEIYASGIRNSVGFDWDPQTGVLHFTDNGRDWLGDDQPPDELNRAPEKGKHFGYPFCHGSRISDPEYGKKKDCTQFEPPILELGPHVASLGMKFYTATMFPKKYHHQIFIAEHGSWNRSSKIGYRVTMAKKDNAGKFHYQVFAHGWLDRNGKVWGRPVDIAITPDGSMLISDDHAGLIYLVRYHL